MWGDSTICGNCGHDTNLPAQVTIHAEAPDVPTYNPSSGSGGGFAVASAVVKLLILAAIIIVLTLVRPVYRYGVMAWDDASVVTGMTALGADGWEVVSCRRAMDGDSGVYECVVKQRTGWKLGPIESPHGGVF